MSVKLQKEHIKLSEVICSRTCQTTTECDIIVPDVKPDVLKVLRVSSEAVITQKNIQAEKVYLQGIIRTDILYIPDGNVLGKVKSICTTTDFSHFVDAKGAKPGMNLSAEAECESAEYTLVNSRKLNIRNKINLGIKVTSLCEVDIATCIDGDEPIAVKSESLKLCNSCCEAERDIIIRERLDVPSGKPDIGEILRFSAKPIPGELRLLDGKAVVKGELKLCTLYCGTDEDSSMQCMEHTVPFTEILEIDGITENMTGEIDYCVKDIYSEICRDSDGDKRSLGAEITLCANVKTSEIMECQILRDAYGLNREIKTETNAYNMEQLVDTAFAQVAQKERVCIPDYLPDVHQVCDCSAVPNIESIQTENGKVTVSGYITCTLLYLTEEQDTPVSGFSHVLPFSHIFDIPGITESSLCDAKAEMEHLDYTITSPRDIEIRSIVAISLKAVNASKTNLISMIDYDTDAPIVCLPSMVIYFVQKGDTLWNIAKRYRTTPDAIIANNGPEKDFLKPGNRIYIFR